MAINVRLVHAFLRKVLKKNPEDGVKIRDVIKLFNAWQEHRGSTELAQVSIFAPLCELYCRISDPACRVDPKEKLVRGFSFSTPELSRLCSIFVNGTGNSEKNRTVVTELMQPLNEINAPL